MQRNITIQEELNEYSPLVAGIPVTNVYSIPDGYFDQLSVSLLWQLQESSVAPFQEVPAGYFDGLAAGILQKIALEENSLSLESSQPGLLDTIPSTNIYEVPTGYFDRLPNELMKRIKATEDDKSSLLESLRHIQVYQVPVGYFDNLATTVVKAVETRPAKVIKMHRRTSVFQYAIAAAITGILGLSLFSLYSNKTSNDSTGISTAAAIQPDNKITEAGSFEKELQSITDDEIVTYLENNGQDIQAALVASVTDEKTLPVEEDYLMDANTLSDFLQDLSLSQQQSNSN